MKKAIFVIILLASTKCSLAQSIDSSYHVFRWNAAHDTIIAQDIKEYRRLKDALINQLVMDSTFAQRQKTNLQNQLTNLNLTIKRLGREIKALRLQ